MSRFMNFIIVFVVTVFLTACGGGGGGTTSPDPVTVNINGIAVDNYLSGATVCIDTNKDNICNNGETSTTTNSSGEFTFTGVTPTDDMVIIAYGGVDATTGTNFPYIIKNIATNKDTNDKVVLSSLNTLVADYKVSANTTLSDAKEKIASFIDSNTTQIISDVVANKTTYPELFAKSLQIFQMIEKINDTANLANNYENSANSFKALTTAIRGNNTLKYSDGTINVTIGSTTINASVSNMKPVFTSSSTISVSENQTNVITLQAHDDNASLSYSIVGGGDANDFNINSSTGVVTFKIAPNYETKSVYTFTANVSDGVNNVTQDVTVNIININETPVITSSSSSFSIAENQMAVGTVVASDPDGDTLSYTLGGTDKDSFEISSSGVITFKNAPNYESGKITYTFNVTVSDGSLSASTTTLTVSITNQNEASPTFDNVIETTVNENQKSAITLAATDADLDTLLYSISGEDVQYFDINQTTGVVTFKNNADYETKSSYSLTATVSDGSLTDTKTVTVRLNNLNDNIPSFLAGATLTKAVDSNVTSVLTLLATDLDGDNLTYAIGGTDASYFNINNSTGVVTFKVTPEHNTSKTSYTFTATVSDGDTNHNQTQTVTILVNMLVNGTPVFANVNYDLTINENFTGTVIDLSATDPDINDTITYGIAAGDDSYFDINQTTGVITFKNAPDYESNKTNYSLIVTASDGTNTKNQNMTITLINLNDNAPVFPSIGTITANENQLSVTTLNAIDADYNTLTYSIIGGTDASSFDINSTTGVVTFITAPDYESGKISYTFSATVSDGDNAHNQTQTVIVNVGNLADNPPVFTSATAVSVNENQTSAITLTASGGNSALTYSISGTDASLLNIGSSSGIVTFKTAPNFESGKITYTFIATVTDGTSTPSQTVTVTILDANDVATFITSPTLTPIYQGNSFSYTAKIRDVDVGDTLTKQTSTIPSGFAEVTTGDNSNSIDIAISGTASDTNVGNNIFKLKAKENATGNYVSQDFNLTVIDINDAPVFTTHPSDVNISYGATLTLPTFNVADGDSQATQTISVITTSSDTNVVEINSSTITSGVVTLKLKGLEPGESNITVTLQDNGGTANGGHDTASYTFKATVRANGWKIYDNQKDALSKGKSINSVDFDGINYVWDSTNRWYEQNSTQEPNVHLQKILMPMKILSSNAETYNKGLNVVKKTGVDGHYYVLKNNYMNASRKTEGSTHTTSIYYESADGNASGIKAFDRYFQHDKSHHAFVSTIIKQEDTSSSYMIKNYNDPDDDTLTDDGDSWIYEKTSDYINASDTNTSYGTAISMSTGYVQTSQLIDKKNDGVDFCGNYYGSGWRLPTAYEMGIKVQTATDGYFGYVPSYV